MHLIILIHQWGKTRNLVICILNTSGKTKEGDDLAHSCLFSLNKGSKVKKEVRVALFPIPWHKCLKAFFASPKRDSRLQPKNYSCRSKTNKQASTPQWQWVWTTETFCTWEHRHCLEKGELLWPGIETHESTISENFCFAWGNDRSSLSDGHIPTQLSPSPSLYEGINIAFSMG